MQFRLVSDGPTYLKFSTSTQDLLATIML